MSQEKVDHNKELKRNRKKIVKRQKTSRMVGKVIAALVCVAIVGFIGYSGYTVYNEAHADDPVETANINVTAISDYLNNLESAE